jgi:RNA polymerase sigma-70 factor (ECF subfamily)
MRLCLAVEETDVIHQVLRGDVDSFRVLVERYQRPVLRMIRNITNDGESCEDIGQDVFLAAYEKLASFDCARSSFSTWLFTIARNKSLNALKRKRAVPLNELPENSGSSNPSDDLSRRELFDQLDRVLQTLPAKQKMAFVLAEFERLPYEQIAQIEGVRIGTIKSRINRAKNKLKVALRDLEAEMP